MRYTTTLVTGPTTMTLMLEKIYPNNVPGMNWGRVAIDTEYYVDEERQYHLAYVQLSNGKEVYVIEGKLTSAAKEREHDLPKRLIPWVTDKRVKKYVSTLRADDTAFLSAYGVSIAGCVADTESMDWLCDENRRSHGLKDGAQDHCDIFMRDFAEVFGYHELKKDGKPKKKRTSPNMRQIVEGSDGGHNVPWMGEEGRAKAVEYAALDPYATYQMAVTLRTRLEKLDLWDWYQGVELPLGRTLIEMERRGIRIDAKSVAHIRREVAADLLRCQHYIRQVADEPALNLRSNPQMQKLLFEKLKWPVVAYNDLTDAQEREGEDEGNPSLNKAALDEYVKKGFGLASHLIFHRSRSTLHNNFLTGVLEKRDSATDLVHTVFKQNRTVTGRLASGDRIQRLMNLQAIPSKKEKDPYRLRQFFLPTKPGYALIVGDYTQVELFVIAQISGDKRMIAAFNRGEDLHMLTGSKIFGIPLPPEPKSWEVTSASYQKWAAVCDEWKAKYKGQRDSAKCFHPDTEVLTRKGWKGILELEKGEEVIQAIPGDKGVCSLEWVVPTEVFSKKHESGQLVRLKCQGIDLRVTPDHRMLGFRYDGKAFVSTPDQFDKVSYWANAGQLEEKGVVVNERLLRLAVAVQADGTLIKGATSITFGFAKQRKIDRLRALLRSGEATESEPVLKTGRGSVVTFYIKAVLGAHIRDLLDPPTKSFPWGWLGLTRELREAVLDEAQYWDGESHAHWKMYSYSNTDRQSVDVLQAIAAITGRKTRIASRPPCRGGVSPSYGLTVRTGFLSWGGGGGSWGKRRQKRNVEIVIERFSGEVACLSVPSTFVLVRDKGIPVITGQSINFGLNYGMSAFKLSKDNNMPLQEAEEWVAGYFELYPGVAKYMKRTIAGCHRTGYVTTIAGRRRTLPDIHDADPQLVGRAERQCINAPIQGSVADIIKVAMNAIEIGLSYRNKWFCPSPLVEASLQRLKQMGLEMLLQVHDELICQVPNEYAEQAAKDVNNVMCAPFPDFFRDVRLTASVHAGPNWLEAKK